jgi:hypothetical protein
VKMPTIEQITRARNRTLRWYRGGGQDYRNVKAAWDTIIEVVRNGGDVNDCEKVLSSPIRVPGQDPQDGTYVLIFNNRR